MQPKKPVAAAQPDYTDEDWRRYSQLTQLVNHWDRPGWTPSRHSYHWLIALDDPALHSLVEQCQAELCDSPGLDLVPLSSLHITLERAGFADELTQHEALAAAEIAKKLCHEIEPFSLRIGPLAGSAGSVRFSARPHDPIRKLRDAVRAAVTPVRGQECPHERPSRFIPHVSIAYCHEAIPAQPVIARVAQLRALGTVTIPVAAIQLVHLWREGQTYRWEELTVVGLGNAEA